jgi:hypothetical protein
MESQVSAELEICLTKQQTAFIRRTLMEAIDSMQVLLMTLHRENARWSSPETDALLEIEREEIAALQHMVDALAKLQKEQGWEVSPNSEESKAAPEAA